MLESKIVLSTLLRRFKFEVSANTKPPIVATQLVLKSMNGINLVVSRRWIGFFFLKTYFNLQVVLSVDCFCLLFIFLHQLRTGFNLQLNDAIWNLGWNNFSLLILSICKT